MDPGLFWFRIVFASLFLIGLAIIGVFIRRGSLAIEMLLRLGQADKLAREIVLIELKQTALNLASKADQLSEEQKKGMQDLSKKVEVVATDVLNKLGGDKENHK